MKPSYRDLLADNQYLTGVIAERGLLLEKTIARLAQAEEDRIKVRSEVTEVTRKMTNAYDQLALLASDHLPRVGEDRSKFNVMQIRWRELKARALML